MEKVTEGAQTTRSRTRADKTPLGSAPPFPEAETRQVKDEKDKEPQLAVIVSEHDQQVCKPRRAQTAKRAKKLLRPHHQDDHLTLAKMKKINAGESNAPIDLTVMKNVIEDCHLPTDETDYADWLIEQGIDPNAPLPDEIDLIDPICKTEHQQAPEIEATKPQMNEPTTDKMAPHSSEQKSETTLQVQHTQEDKLDEETGQKLKADYLGQFQTDLNSFIWSSGLEEETFV